MKLLYSEFENVCQHRALKHTWHVGLNGIVGPNGAGKSNTLKMIEAGLTGNFRVNHGNKDDNVALLALPNARSRIVLHLEHGDAKLEVIRALRGTTTEVKINGGETIRGDTRVNEVLADVFGVDARILSEFVFVKQRNIFTFLDDNDSTRAELFQKLFGTERAATVHSLLGKELSSLLIPQVSAEPEMLTERVAETKAKLDKLYAARKRYENVTGEQAEDVAQVHDYELAKRVRAECRQLRDRGLEAQRQLRAAKPEYQKWSEELEMLTGAIEELAGPLAEAQAAKLEWVRFKKDAQVRASLQTQRLKLEAALGKLVEPRVPDALIDASARWAKVQETLLAQIRDAERLVRTFNGQTAECPTCGTAADSLEAKVCSAREALPSLLATRDELMDGATQYDELVRQHQTWFQTKERYEQQLAQLEVTAGSLGSVLDPPVVTEAQLADVLADQAAFQDALKIEIRPAFDKARRNVDQLRNRLRLYYEQYLAKKAELPTVIPTRDEYRAARRRVAQANSRLARKKLVELRIQDCTEALNGDLSLIEWHREQEAQAVKLRAWAEELRGMQSAVHHSALPRLVSQENLAAVQEDINDLLVRFGVRFRVELTERLSFNVRYDDGRVHAATRLSDGQKVVFALAFRVAVNALFTGDVGLFCLDEPTDSLDAKNLACLELALGRLRELSHSRGLQCLLVTHERKLARMFDAVLDLA